MFILLLFLASLFSPLQQTSHCYALPEPFKHWPIYLEVTEELNTCTHNWYTAPVFLEDVRHTPSIWSPDYTPGSITEIATLASDYPGRTWLFFNEPELEGQSNTAPEIAAVHVRYWTEAVGENGKVACCGNLIYPPLGGYQWIEKYLESGGNLPDFWHIHIYVANEWEFQNVLGGWERWNSAHGNLPTIISEVGSGQEFHDWLLTWNDDKYPAVYWFGINEVNGGDGVNILSSEFVYFPLLSGE